MALVIVPAIAWSLGNFYLTGFRHTEYLIYLSMFVLVLFVTWKSCQV